MCTATGHPSRSDSFCVCFPNRWLHVYYALILGRMRLLVSLFHKGHTERQECTELCGAAPLYSMIGVVIRAILTSERQTDGRTNPQTDGETEREGGREGEKEKLTDQIEKHTETDRHTERRTEKQTQKERQAERQRERERKTD